MAQLEEVVGEEMKEEMKEEVKVEMKEEVEEDVREDLKEVKGKGDLVEEVDRLTELLVSAMDKDGEGWREEAPSLGTCSKCGGSLEEEGLEVGGEVFHPTCFTCSSCSIPLTGAFWTVEGKRCNSHLHLLLHLHLKYLHLQHNLHLHLHNHLHLTPTPPPAPQVLLCPPVLWPASVWGVWRGGGGGECGGAGEEAAPSLPRLQDMQGGNIPLICFFFIIFLFIF